MKKYQNRKENRVVPLKVCLRESELRSVKEAATKYSISVSYLMNTLIVDGLDKFMEKCDRELCHQNAC